MFKKQITTVVLLSILFSVSAQNTINDTLSNGFVTFYYPETKIISSQGYMKDGQPDGYWKNFYQNGIIKSEGNRKNFLLDSTWKFYDDSARLLVSINYKNGKKNGIKTTYRQGEVIEENFFNDVKEGFSHYYHANGKIRISINFLNGLEQGSSVEYDTSGNIISFFKYKNGILVDRECINRSDSKGYKQGKWKYFYDNLVVKEEGNYKNDKKNGYFKSYDKDGNLLSVKKYINDIEQTEAPEVADIKVKTDYYPNGTVKTVGLYKNDVPEGVRTEYNEQGEVTQSYVFSKGIITSQGIVDVLGKKQGEWKHFYEDGSLKSYGSYSNDKPIGNWKYFYPDGKVESEGAYTNKGNLNGLWKWYYEDGSIRRIENYFDGLQDGEYIEYNEKGEIIVSGNYEMGLEEGKWSFVGDNFKETGEYKGGAKFGEWITYYSDGTIKFKGEYIDNNLNGKVVWYWSNGKPKDIGYYNNGRKHGNYTYYNEDGTVFLVVTYRNNVEVLYDGVKIKPPFTDE